MQKAWFRFHGYIARRRIIEYGFEYDFVSRRTSVARAISDFLKPLQRRAAVWAGVQPDEIVEAVITEYTPGAPIGSHRDGLSLKLSSAFYCRAAADCALSRIRGREK
jgi:alkylated DNA repair dioxygenase AlkB